MPNEEPLAGSPRNHSWEDVTEQLGRKAAEEYATAGPLSKIFMSPVARVLDQSRFVGNLEITITTLAEATNLTYHTVEKIVRHLIILHFMRKGRRIGNTQTYRFNVEKELSPLLAFIDVLQRNLRESIHHSRKKVA